MSNKERKRMNIIRQIETRIETWLGKLPRLPKDARDWLGDNSWWLVIIFIVTIGVDALGSLAVVLSNLMPMGASYTAAYYSSATFLIFSTIKAMTSFGFSIIEIILLSVAIQPLRQRNKKGWVLVFAALLIHAIATIVGAVLSLNAFNFMVDIIFGALWLGFLAYFLFEIRGDFVRVVSTKKSTEKALKRATKKAVKTSVSGTSDKQKS